jgi:hypothetical protein
LYCNSLLIDLRMVLLGRPAERAHVDNARDSASVRVVLRTSPASPSTRSGCSPRPCW